MFEGCVSCLKPILRFLYIYIFRIIGSYLKENLYKITGIMLFC